MNDKPNAETETQAARVSELENSATTPSIAPIDPFLGFRVDRKERDALFHRWFWRGAALSLVSAIFIGGSTHEVLVVVWSTVVINLILALIKSIIMGKKDTPSITKETVDKDNTIVLKNIYEVGMFIGGHGIGLISISFLMHTLIPFFKHILKI